MIQKGRDTITSAVGLGGFLCVRVSVESGSSLLACMGV